MLVLLEYNCVNKVHFNLITLLQNYDIILIMFFSRTVPSIDSNIPVTIQSVITGNIVEITAFVNVRLSHKRCTYMYSVEYYFVCVYIVYIYIYRNTICTCSTLSMGNYPGYFPTTTSLYM